MDYGPICGLVLRRTTSPPPTETNTVCSLLRYFSIILFAAYTINRQILLHFHGNFGLSFFDIVSIKTLFQNCIFVQKIAEIYSLGGAIDLFAAYTVYACILNAFSHPMCRPSLMSSPSIFFHINCLHKFRTWCHQSVCCLFSLWAYFYAFCLEISQLL